jgi:hypothetical protein
VLIQTGAEEVLFRGYMQQQLAARFSSPIMWMMLPSAIFAALHYQPEIMGDNTWLMMGAVFVFAVLAADLTAVTGNIGAAWAMHFVNNALAILVVATDGPLSGLALYIAPISPASEGYPAALLPRHRDHGRALGGDPAGPAAAGGVGKRLVGGRSGVGPHTESARPAKIVIDGLGQPQRGAVSARASPGVAPQIGQCHGLQVGTRGYPLRTGIPHAPVREAPFIDLPLPHDRDRLVPRVLRDLPHERRNRRPIALQYLEELPVAVHQDPGQAMAAVVAPGSHKNRIENLRRETGGRDTAIGELVDHACSVIPVSKARLVGRRIVVISSDDDRPTGARIQEMVPIDNCIRADPERPA